MRRVNIVAYSVCDVSEEHALSNAVVIAAVTNAAALNVFANGRNMRVVMAVVLFYYCFLSALRRSSFAMNCAAVMPQPTCEPTFLPSFNITAVGTPVMPNSLPSFVMA